MHAYLLCVPAELYKKDGSTMLTAKAWNSRVLTQWFHICLSDAVSRQNYLHDPENQLPLQSAVTILVVARIESVLNLLSTLGKS